MFTRHLSWTTLSEEIYGSEHSHIFTMPQYVSSHSNVYRLFIINGQFRQKFCNLKMCHMFGSEMRRIWELSNSEAWLLSDSQISLMLWKGDSALHYLAHHATWAIDLVLLHGLHWAIWGEQGSWARKLLT